jgi:hypothetical protein
MPVGFGNRAEKQKEDPSRDGASEKEYFGSACWGKLSCARAIIAVAKLTNDPNYKQYRMGRKKILPKVRELLQASGVDLSRGGGIPELRAFQSYLSQYRIVVYWGCSATTSCLTVM